MDELKHYRLASVFEHLNAKGVHGIQAFTCGSAEIKTDSATRVLTLILQEAQFIHHGRKFFRHAFIDMFEG